MKPGPKPKQRSLSEFGEPSGISLGWLKSQAYVWNMVLHGLRDGEPGFIAKIVARERPKLRLGPVVDSLTFWNVVHQFDPVAQAEWWRRGLSLANFRKGKVVSLVAIFPKYSKDALELVKGKKDWLLTPPTPPRREHWERLKKARSVAGVRRIGRELHELRALSAPQWAAIYCHAEDFLRAKKLHNYPGDRKRPKSDDKRIHFLAKVLSGFMQGRSTRRRIRLKIDDRWKTIRFYCQEGIAPTTATKRLSHLALPGKDDFLKYWQQYGASFSKRLRKEQA
ncbi:MAG TPA: hypothetical protein VHM88_27460 [Candidatus Acidoferrales bacterium]|jgi:hypothetical protein|nr:hypothetical protein [Candidatus Acidoferrales bacterium]